MVFVVAALVAAPGFAGAGKKHKKHRAPAWKSTVTLTLDSSGTTFSGKVGSKLNACLAARRVSMAYFDPDGTSNASVAVERTDKKGKYSITLPTPAYAGSYRLDLWKQKVRAQGRKNLCKAAQAPILTH